MRKHEIHLTKNARVYPDPASKDLFLRKYRTEFSKDRMSNRDMIRSQIGYIRMPVWVVSLFALAVAIIGLSFDRSVLFAAAAIMPFVSWIAVLESFRAERFGLSEMEKVTFISRRGALFARIACVGTVHIVLLLLLTVMTGTKGGYGLCLRGSILTIPYLISSVVNMELERTQFGRKNALPGLGVAALTSVSVLMAKKQSGIFSYDYRIFWYLLVAALIVTELMEIKKSFYEVEYAWN